MKTGHLQIVKTGHFHFALTVARILSAVFEQDLLELSYGYRAGRSPHGALKALRSQIIAKKVRHIYEADIKGYFTNISHQWLRKMVRERIADRTILRLIDKWLKAGVMINVTFEVATYFSIQYVGYIKSNLIYLGEDAV